MLSKNNTKNNKKPQEMANMGFNLYVSAYKKPQCIG